MYCLVMSTQQPLMHLQTDFKWIENYGDVVRFKGPFGVRISQSTYACLPNDMFSGGSSTHRRPEGHSICVSNRRIPVPQTSRTPRSCFSLHWKRSSLGRRFVLFSRMRPSLSDSLLGANHRRQRKIMIPAFRSRESRSFVPIFNAAAAKVPHSSVPQTQTNNCL